MYPVLHAALGKSVLLPGQAGSAAPSGALRLAVALAAAIVLALAADFSAP